MISLEWTELAEKQKNQIVDYIALDNVAVAVDMDILIENSAESLLAQPEKARPGRVPGTREFVFHEHYTLIYKYSFEDRLISILNALHTSREWPQVP
ncbi:MAG: type II toxin-antitoxin system RelE/ParE family toxin [Deltaproteobacteria bacterium]|jgi:plasmid stabilization system protein ParE|nr:type II toxin-antitoxin system RelE/ParE family toxin [Deltaproteobacteria bacterium]